MTKEKRTINRKCLCCGNGIEVEVKENGEYTGGHYFGEIKSPTGDGEWKNTGEEYEGMKIAEWTGEWSEEEEYWECDSCYNND